MGPYILFPFNISVRNLRNVYEKDTQQTLQITRKTPVGRELDAWTHRPGSSEATTAQTNEKSPYENNILTEIQHVQRNQQDTARQKSLDARAERARHFVD